MERELRNQARLQESCGLVVGFTLVSGAEVEVWWVEVQGMVGI